VLLRRGFLPNLPVLEDIGDDAETKEALSRNQLEVFTAGETYLRTRPFTTEGILDFWKTTVPVAAAEGGYEFSRLTGEMPWALHDLPDEREEFFRYEAELNRFAPRYPQAIVCLYDLGHFGGGILLDLLRTHPKLVVSGQLVENPLLPTPRSVPLLEVLTPLHGPHLGPSVPRRTNAAPEIVLAGRSAQWAKTGECQHGNHL